LILVRFARLVFAGFSLSLIMPSFADMSTDLAHVPLTFLRYFNIGTGRFLPARVVVSKRTIPGGMAEASSETRRPACVKGQGKENAGENEN
jgi:hypothetical protein